MFFAGACAGAERLRREVLELFLLHGEQDSLLDAPLDGGDALAELATPASGWVGAWRLVRELGRGGMGVVYLGEFGSGDGRPAAVQLLAAGAVSPAICARFRL